MDQLTPDQMDALNNLMEQLALAEDTVVNTVEAEIRRSSRIANKEPIDYAELNRIGTTGKKGGKRKRKMRGGGVCTEGPKKWAYNLAIDSVLVIAGAAGITTGVFAGWNVLSIFINAFGLGATFLAIIKAVYDILRVISIHLLLNIPLAAWSSLKTSANFSATFAYDSIVETIRNSDALINGTLIRYILTENDAITDINTILATLEQQYAVLRGNVSSWTRSGKEKMRALQGQIERLSSAAIGHAATGLVAAQPANDFYIRIKEAICIAIDRGKDDACATAGVINIIMDIYGFRQIQTDGGCTISGGRRRRKSKRSTRKGKRSTKRTKKNSRRSSRRK